MSITTSITTALCLAAPDVEALIQGRMIAALSKTFISSSQHFAICSAGNSLTELPVEQCYQPSFLSIAQAAIDSFSGESIYINAWAKLESCKIYNDLQDLDKLAKLTIWTNESLQNIVQERYRIFLNCLRVYLLPKPLKIPKDRVSTNKLGSFIKLSDQLLVENYKPVLSDNIFRQRKKHLEELNLPIYPELEILQGKVSLLAINHTDAKALDHLIQNFLGWRSASISIETKEDLSWIYTINDLGNATTGGNYEKGTAFERIVHQSLAFLGFELNPNAKGGAGGLDLHCTKPYSLVGECKSGKGIPGHTVYELDKLEDIHLDDPSEVKLIIGPGKPTPQLQDIAQKRCVSIIHPMTLQKLVELQAKYPNSINLIELKDYLVAGQIDYKIEEYIDKVLKDIQIRSHIIEAVKQLTEIDTERKQFEVSEIRVQYNALFSKHDSGALDLQTIHEALIELSSPLAGYLGRLKGTSLTTDRFYFLRDLVID